MPASPSSVVKGRVPPKRAWSWLPGDGPHAERRAQTRELREEFRVGIGARRLVDQVAAQQHQVRRLAEGSRDPRADGRGADELPVVEVGQPGDAKRRAQAGERGPLAHHVERVGAEGLRVGRPQRRGGGDGGGEGEEAPAVHDARV